MKKYKIVSPIRFFIFVLIVTFVIIFGLVTLFGSNRTEAASVNTYTQVKVEADDTLWSIASDYIDDSTDIRSFIYEIREINDIEDGESLHVGDLLFIPVLS